MVRLVKFDFETQISMLNLKLKRIEKILKVSEFQIHLLNFNSEFDLKREFKEGDHLIPVNWQEA